MAAPGTRDITLYQGDDYTHTISFTRNNSPYAVPGTFKAQIKASRSSRAAVLATFAVDDSDIGSGNLVISLTSAQTTGLPVKAQWDLQVTNAGVVQTLLSGAVTVTQQVTT